MVLPSGKTVEVVYIEDPLSTSLTGPGCDEAPDQQLHVCDRCDSTLVYPLEWEEASETHWQVTLRCPSCEWKETGVYAQAVVERFDLALDRATAALVDDLQRLTIANMEEQIDRFSAALDADLILPEDF